MRNWFLGIGTEESLSKVVYRATEAAVTLAAPRTGVLMLTQPTCTVVVFIDLHVSEARSHACWLLTRGLVVKEPGVSNPG